MVTALALALVLIAGQADKPIHLDAYDVRRVIPTSAPGIQHEWIIKTGILDDTQGTLAYLGDRILRRYGTPTGTEEWEWMSGWHTPYSMPKIPEELYRTPMLMGKKGNVAIAFYAMREHRGRPEIRILVFDPEKVADSEVGP